MVPVTDVKLFPITEPGPTRAIGSVTLAGAFVIHGVRVVEGENGLFVAMPQKKDGNKYRDVAHPITGPMRGLLSSAVLEAYEQLQVREQPAPKRASGERSR
jgi:stage V sporulation protein G